MRSQKLHNGFKPQNPALLYVLHVQAFILGCAYLHQAVIWQNAPLLPAMVFCGIMLLALGVVSFMSTYVLHALVLPYRLRQHNDWRQRYSIFIPIILLGAILAGIETIASVKTIHEPWLATMVRAVARSGMMLYVLFGLYCLWRWFQAKPAEDLTLFAFLQLNWPQVQPASSDHLAFSEPGMIMVLEESFEQEGFTTAEYFLHAGLDFSQICEAYEYYLFAQGDVLVSRDNTIPPYFDQNNGLCLHYILTSFNQRTSECTLHILMYNVSAGGLAVVSTTGYSPELAWNPFF